MKKFLPAFMLAGVIALALPATGHATVAGLAPVTVLFNIVHVQAQIIQSQGAVECGVIIQTRTQPPVAVASAEIPLGPLGRPWRFDRRVDLGAAPQRRLPGGRNLLR